MSYTNTLTPQQKSNINLIVKACIDAGITNPMSIAATLAIASKESELIPREETGYAGTSNARIRKIFGSRVAQLSENQLTELKKDKTKFFNLVYAKTAGNEGGNDGSRYLGRGFNQLTGKANYAAYGAAIGVDLINNPSLALTPDVASRILVEYNKRTFRTLANVGKLKDYNSKDINGFTNLTDAVLAFYHVTAGAGKSVAYVKGLLSKDVLGGMTKAQNRGKELLAAVNQQIPEISKKKHLCPHCSQPLP